MKKLLLLSFFLLPGLTQAAYHVYPCSEISAGGATNVTCSGDDIQFSSAGFSVAQTVTPDTFITEGVGHIYYVKVTSTGTVGNFQVLLSGDTNNSTGYFSANETNTELSVAQPAGTITTAIGFPGVNTDAVVTYLCISENAGECPDSGVPPPPPTPSDFAFSTTTLVTDSPTQDIFMGVLVFFIVMSMTIWIFKL